MTTGERAELREWVTASRRAQGLPDRISDPSVLARAREILRPNRTQAPASSPGPASRTPSSSGTAAEQFLPITGWWPMRNDNAETADVSNAAAARQRLRESTAPPILSDPKAPVPPLHLPVIREGDGGAWAYTDPQHDDDDVITGYRQELAEFLNAGRAKIQLRMDNADLDAEVHKQRIREQAREQVKAERADAAFERPPYRSNLGEEFLEPVEAPAPRITGLSYKEHNVLLAAKAKVGKSTLILSLIRSLADGVPFLGSLAVTPPAGRVGYINYEMSQGQMNQWLRDAGVQHPERVAVLHLRGYSLPLLGETVQDFYVEWAKECGVEVLIADPWGRMMVGSGSENSNDDVRAVLGILGEIKRRAGIADLFVAAHMGHTQAEIGQERARGASELLGWPDALWNLNKVAETRFLSATGRDIDFTEQGLVYDPDSRSMTLDGGTTDRATAKATAAEAEVVRIVAAKPGQLTTKVKARMTSTTNQTARTDAVQCAVESGRIRVEKVGAAKLLYPSDTTTILPWEPRFEATP